MAWGGLLGTSLGSLGDAVMVPLRHERTLAAKDQKGNGSPLNIQSFLMMYQDKNRCSECSAGHSELIDKKDF